MEDRLDTECAKVIYERDRTKVFAGTDKLGLKLWAARVAGRTYYFGERGRYNVRPTQNPTGNRAPWVEVTDVIVVEERALVLMVTSKGRRGRTIIHSFTTGYEVPWVRWPSFEYHTTYPGARGAIERTPMLKYEPVEVDVRGRKIWSDKRSQLFEISQDEWRYETNFAAFIFRKGETYTAVADPTRRPKGGAATVLGVEIWGGKPRLSIVSPISKRRTTIVAGTFINDYILEKQVKNPAPSRRTHANALSSDARLMARVETLEKKFETLLQRLGETS